MIISNKKQLLRIITVLLAVGAAFTIFWKLNEIYGWLQNQTQEILIALVMAILAGILVESVYKKISPQSKILKTTRTHLIDHQESLAQLVLPNKNNIVLDEAEKVIGREDFLGVETSDKLYFIGKDHFKIMRKDNNYYIQDLNTKNGTKVNGKEIKGSGMHRLNDGDEIMIAKTIKIKYVE